MLNQNLTGRVRLDESIAALRNGGERVTTARRLVLEILAGTDEHLNADDISTRITELSPSIHRATVYRTLDSLARLRLISHVHLPHGAATYHLADAEDRLHLHLACRMCGKIVDASPDLLDAVATRLAESTGFVLDPEHAALTGWCERCSPSTE